MQNLEITQPATRLRSLDVYRGFVMLLMMGEVLSFSKVDHALPGNWFWQLLHFNQSHVEWAGCSLHDMIQPSFSFSVGAAMPFSIAARLKKGSTFTSLWWHAGYRSLILIFLGIFLRSTHKEMTYFTFEDTLTQIGLGYIFLFFLAYAGSGEKKTVWRRSLVITFLVLMAGYWLAFLMYPLPGADFDYTLAGVPPNWDHNFTGLAAHWNKNSNLAWAFDRWFLNLFPRQSPFTNNGGGYATLSFIPTLCTMILGLVAGNMLRSSAIITSKKLRAFLVTGTILIAISILLHFTGINPIVKRIWTPAWTLFSGGVCFYILSLLYFTNDVRLHRKWSFPLMVIGMNSIAAYVMAETLVSFFATTLHIHLGPNYDAIFGTAYRSLVSGTLILLIEWLILYWMYKRRIFIKV